MFNGYDCAAEQSALDLGFGSVDKGPTTWAFPPVLVIFSLSRFIFAASQRIGFVPSYSAFHLGKRMHISVH